MPDDDEDFDPHDIERIDPDYARERDIDDYWES